MDSVFHPKEHSPGSNLTARDASAAHDDSGPDVMADDQTTTGLTGPITSPLQRVITSPLQRVITSPAALEFAPGGVG